MKLRIFAIAAGFVLLPALAHAQGTDTTAARKTTDTTAARKTTDTTAARKTTSRSTDCPRGCPTSKGAAGLTGVQFLALQQELRDRGCGNTSVTGVYDGATRRAVAVCAKRLSVANKAPAVLVAMDIGYSAADTGAASPPPGTTD
jgi:peptidoglycan hydrolase-like protein with peptidoglycan-binding domain